MATLVLPNFPEKALHGLKKRAALSNRTIEEELLIILEEDLGLRPADDDSGPLAFDRPLEGTVAAVVYGGAERMPAPLFMESTTPE